ncbi:MAG: MFS transporter [Halofilum sp. (in: g-proteobacteria)]|nr:MFS transporter [Halofilum sp. (in: g-proteobacteria)]
MSNDNTTDPVAGSAHLEVELASGPPGPSGRRLVFAMLASITAVGITLGITGPLFSVLLDRMGLNTALVGLNTSLGVGATLIAAPLVPFLLVRFGVVPVMMIGILLSAGGILAAAFYQHAGLWFLLRFVIGIGMSLHWVISETCINRFSSDHNRGFVAGVYSALFGLGFAIGPMIVRWLGVDGLLPFAVSAGLVLIAAIPLLYIRGAAPAMEHEQGQTTMSVLRLAPVVMLAAFISGFVDNAALALLPLYGIRFGLAEGASVELLAIATFGAVMLQLPIGWLSDRIGRSTSIIICAVGGSLTVLLLPYVLDLTLMLWAVLFLWGGTTVAFYTLALALLGESFRGTTLAKANSTLVIAYCLGSIVGPPATGGAMDWVGPNGFVIVMAAASALLIVGAIVWRPIRDATWSRADD